MDPFAASSANDPFAAAFGPTASSRPTPGSGSDPFWSDPLRVRPTPGSGSDPFGSDPFAPPAGAASAKGPATQDDWFVSAQSPFRAPPKVDGVRMGSKSHKQLSKSSKSLATNWGTPSAGAGAAGNVSKVGNADPFSSGPATILPTRASKSSSKMSDFLHGGKESSSKEPKEKKKHKLGLPKSLKLKSSGHKAIPEVPSSTTQAGATSAMGASRQSTASAPPMQTIDEVHLKMASEASRRAEDDRNRRMRLQEEQDLAYAIALSKAEAASLKTTTSTAS